MAAPARPRVLVGGSAVAGHALEVSTTRDRELVRSFLEGDRLMSGYAYCALDERPFAQSRWSIATRDREPVALVVEHGGPTPQPLYVAGEPDAVELLLRNVARPWSAYISGLPELIPAIARLYRLEPGPQMVRMAVDRERFRPYAGPVQRLIPASIGELNRMYDLGFTAWLPSEAIAEGVYYGLRVAGRLVAAAGTHAISREGRMGIVGNVMTIRSYQGRGFAKATTSAVTAELLRTCDDVILNVRSDNPPALATYRALGFHEHARFEERLAHRRAGGWAALIGVVRRSLGL